MNTIEVQVVVKERPNYIEIEPIQGVTTLGDYNRMLEKLMDYYSKSEKVRQNFPTNCYFKKQNQYEEDAGRLFKMDEDNQTILVILLNDQHSYRKYNRNDTITIRLLSHPVPDKKDLILRSYGSTIYKYNKESDPASDSDSGSGSSEDEKEHSFYVSSKRQIKVNAHSHTKKRKILGSTRGSTRGSTKAIPKTIH